jgi:hypothetical protein
MSLQEVIKQIRGGGRTRDHWLFIQGSAEELALSTDCALSRVEIDEDSEDLDEIIPPEFANRGLRSTIDFETVKDCIAYADQLVGAQNDAAAAEVIRYYIRFDSVPQNLGAPDPPSWEETMIKLDREFFESLGPERDGTICRAPECSQGAIQFSAFCARHHFESIKKRPYPF